MHMEMKKASGSDILAVAFEMPIKACEQVSAVWRMVEADALILPTTASPIPSFF